MKKLATLLMALCSLMSVNTSAQNLPQTTDPTNSDTYKGWVDNTTGQLAGQTIVGTTWSGPGADLPTARFIYINPANFPDDDFRNFFKNAKHEDYFTGDVQSAAAFADALDSYIYRMPTVLYNRNVAESAVDNLFTEAELQSITAIVVERENPYSYHVDSRKVSVADLSGIEFFTELKDFSVSFIGERFPLMSDKLETTMFTTCKNLLEFDASVYPNLQWMFLGGSLRMTSLDLSQNQALIGARIRNHASLSHVNLSGLSSIQQLCINLNPSLEQIDLSDNVGLKRLGLDNNNLCALNLSKNTELELLSATNNQITHLDLSNNKQLYGVWVGTNKLTELDVSQLALLGSKPANPGGFELGYRNQRRQLTAESFGVTTGTGADAVTNRYYYFRLDSTLVSADEKPIVERMTTTNFMSEQSQFVPARATWLTGGTVIDGTRTRRAAGAPGQDEVYGKILLLEPTTIENGVASGTVTYTYDVNYRGTGTDPQHVFTLLWTADAAGVVTSVVDLPADALRGAPVSTTYHNLAGQTADRPFDGVNIVITRYQDGTATTTKILH